MFESAPQPKNNETKDQNSTVEKKDISLSPKVKLILLSLGFAISSVAQNIDEGFRLNNTNSQNIDGQVSMRVPTRNGGTIIIGGGNTRQGPRGDVEIITPQGGRVGVGVGKEGVDVGARTPRGDSGGTVRIPRN